MKILIEKKEKIKTPLGTFNTFKVSPMLLSEGIFKNNGKVSVWITDDDLKLPVKMRAKVYIGYVSAILVEYEK